jgi:hypothetical protein
VLHKGVEPGHEEVLEGMVETVIHEIAVTALSCRQFLYGKYKFKPPLAPVVLVIYRAGLGKLGHAAYIWTSRMLIKLSQYHRPTAPM